MNDCNAVLKESNNGDIRDYSIEVETTGRD